MEAPLTDEPASSIGDGPRVIVVAVDDSPRALRAASYATGLARRNRSTLVYVHVVSPPLSVALAETAGYVPELEECKEGARGNALLSDFARATALQCGVEVKCALRQGTPAQEIARVANEVHADAVVVGNSRRRLRPAGRSIAVQLARRGAWPVTVVP